MVMIQKAGAIVKACNGEQSPLFVDLRGTALISPVAKILPRPLNFRSVATKQVDATPRRLRMRPG